MKSYLTQYKEAVANLTDRQYGNLIGDLVAGQFLVKQNDIYDILIADFKCGDMFDKQREIRTAKEYGQDKRTYK